MARTPLVNVDQLRELAARNLTLSQIAAQMGVQYQLARLYARRHGIDVAPGKRGARSQPPAVVTARALRMATMYRQGLTLEKVGEHFKVSRERVRQIITKQGVRRAEGGQSKVAASKVQALQSKRDAASLVRFGIPYEDKKRYREDGTLAAYAMQEKNAASRGITWGLSFKAWLDVWLESGKLAQRGRGKDHYVMSRMKDEGGYVLGNVHIQLSTDNNREGLAKCRANKSAVPGVWRIYPGSDKPYVAHIGDQKMRRFATEAEAIAARKASGVEARKRGLGYAVIHKRGKVRYQVTLGKRYVGTYKTPEAALAARDDALLQQPALLLARSP